MIRWVRSWPARPPAGRPHVVDDLERLVIDDYDYTPLGELELDPYGGVVVIEWDIAVDPRTALIFEERIRGYPDQVSVGPYYLDDALGVRWAHRVVRGSGAGQERWIRVGESCADYFGFGLVYLPTRLVRAFLAAEAPERGRPPWVPRGLYQDGRFTDQTFSTWHFWRSRQAGRRALVWWECQAVHLHASS